MKTTCLVRRWMMFDALLYLAGASWTEYIYYLEGSEVSLDCSFLISPSEFEWIGPAQTSSYYERSESSLHGHRITWNVSAYTDGHLLSPNLPHSFRLKVSDSVNFSLRIINASVMDEGLYVCQQSIHDIWSRYYILKMIDTSRVRYIYYPVRSTVLLKCLQDMDWFRLKYSSMIDMQGNLRRWMVYRLRKYEEDGPVSLFRHWHYHNRLQVKRQIQAGYYVLQLSHASVFDEGLYFCEDSEMTAATDYYVLQLINETVVSSMHTMVEEINEGESKTICCHTPTIWIKKRNKTILVEHNVNKSCYLNQHVNRYDEVNYTCIADKTVGSGSVTIVLKIRYKPEVSIKQGSIENANEGETKKVCCCIESYPTPTLIRWLNGSQQILVAYNVTDICYTFNKVSRYDQGNYTCTAENIMGSGSNTTVLKVQYKPLVSSMTNLTEEMNEGQQKKLCCYVDSNPTPISTIWLNGSQEILVTHEVNETCYNIKSVNRYDQGNYTCITENIIGIGSVTVVLIVNYKPEVSIIHDFSEDVHEGGTDNVCCYGDSNPSPTSIRWFNESQEISVKNNATEICYTINNVSRYDQRNYTCIAENIVGRGLVRTVFRVKYKPLVLIKHDLIEETNEGETKTLCCYVDSNPAPTSTSWFNENQEISVTHNSTDTCFTIEKVSRYDSGVYTCIAENIIGIGSLATILQVNYKPEVSIINDFSEDVHEGGTDNVCCYGDSNPSPTSIRWFNGSQEISVKNNATEICYTINNVSRYDQRNYTCIAKNIIGRGSVRTVLRVKYKPLVLIKHDLIEETNEGGTKTLCCYVDSNPATTSTSWFNENQEISVTHNGTDTCFTIEKVSRYDSGVYTCIAENIIGIGSLATILKVNYKPVVSRKHDLIEEIHEGETKNLCCYVDSNTAITSTRLFNGSKEIFTTHNVTETCYTIKNVSRYDQGIYTCTAENTIGSGSITIVLQVKSNYQLNENVQPLQSVVLGGLLGTIAVLVVGMGILFFHMQRKKKQRILSTINLGSQRGNDDESGHYMEIYTIDESIVMPWQENSRPIIATVERSVVETRDIDTISAGNSSTSSDDDRNASGYLDDGYEHAYNTLLSNNRDEGEHVSMNVRDFIFADNDNSIISTVERAVIENVYIGLTSAGHSSTSSDDDRNVAVYLEDGYEHPYNTLLANNRDDDEHVYLTPSNTPNSENETPSENVACGCLYELTEQDSSPEQAKTHCEENDDKNNESEI